MGKHTKVIVMVLLIVTIIAGCTIESTDTGIKELEEELIEPEGNSEEELVETVETDKVEDIENEVADHNTGNIEIHFIDVGQGDSILIKQGNSSMLVDAGDNKYGKTVVDYLYNQGLSKLDYVIGTHPHADHIGGLDDVINTFDVGKVIMPKVTHTTKTFEDVMEAIQNKGLKITTPIVGDEYILGGANFKILAPNGENYGNLNNYSVAIKIEFGKNSFIFTGDAEELSEQEMVNSGMNLKADLLKLGHHGSNTSSTSKFIDEVSPTYGVIQVAEINKYNHPDADILKRMEDRGIRIYRNDAHGNIVVTSDGKNIEFKTDKNGIVKDKAQEIQSEEDSTDSTDSNYDMYIANKNSKVLHKGSCKSLPKESNREYFDRKQTALQEGYTPCKICKP